MRRFRKIVRAVVLTLLILAVAVPSGVYVVLSTPWGRQKVCTVATTRLSELLGTEVYIGNLVYHPFNTLVLNHIRVKDDNGTTAFQAARLSARFELWNFLKTGRLEFDYAVIDAPYFQLYRATPESPLNINGIIERLQPKDKNKPPTDFDLRIGTVILSKGRFSYDVLSEPLDSTGTFNKNHINVSRLDLRAYLRHGSPDSWDAALEKFSMVERSGFTISDLTVDVLVTPQRLALRSFSLKLPESSFSLQPLDLRINGYASIPDIITRRSLLLRPRGPVIIATSDLACFSPVLGQIDRTFTATFDIDASMRKVNINNLEFSDLKGMNMEITGSVSHLDQPDSLQFNILRLSLKAPAASTTPLLAAIRPNLANITGHTGDISLLGSGAGNLYGARLDFSAAARGARLSFNGAVATPDRYRSASFNGHAKFSGIDLGDITGVSDLGEFAGTLDGSGNIAPGRISASGELAVASLEFKEHSFSDITARGSYDNSTSTVNLTLNSDDPAALLALNVDINPTGDYKTLQLDGAIKSLDLGALGIKGKANHRLSGVVKADFGGRNIDDTEGLLEISDIAYTDSVGKGLHIDRFSFDIDRSGTNDLITVESDILNGTIEGRIAPSSLATTVMAFVSDIAPAALTSEPKRGGADNSFVAVFTLANAEDFSRFFNLPVQIIYPIDITASLDGPGGMATFCLDAAYLQQGDKIIDSTVITAAIDTADSRATFMATTHMPTKKGPMTAVIGISGSDNRFDTGVDWIIDRKIPLNGHFNFSTCLERLEDKSLAISTDFNPGEINFGDNVWQIGTSSIVWAQNTLTIDDFSLKADEQSIDIDGRASALPTDTLSLSLRNITLESIFETLEIENALIGGRASGDFTVASAFSSIPELYTDGLHVDSIAYNYCVIGTADVKANWDNERRSFFLDAAIVNPEGLPSHIWGDIFPMNESLDLNFEANHVRVGFMKPFMKAFTSDLSGYVSGKAHLFGTFKDIDLTGDVYAEDLRLKIDFTNTWYEANDSIHIEPGLIKLDGIVIDDMHGHTALLDGWLRHEYFHFPVFEFNITEAHDFLCYNVNSRLNPDWYGTIYGNGSACVKGHPGVVEIGVKMSTAPHSTFTFVLSDRLDAEQYSFITFNDRTEVALEESLLSIDDIPDVVKEFQARQAASAVDAPSNYLMDIRMDITPDAELIIVMDPVGGDRIRAFGSGDLAMEYNSAENFLGMRGTYTLDRGNYNFTLQDIIIKDFTIEPGSSITFKGDPYSAELNLQAVYSLNANLSDLDESFTQDRELNRTNVPVQALLNVTGDMRQPDISFDLRFPTLTSDTYRKVRSIISTEDMMSRQIIYLLALNRFYTPDYMESTTKGNEIFSVAASTLTSLISNMLGKLSDKWSIAPNLRSDSRDVSDVEVDVALSSRLLNNRLLLNGNFGYRDKSLNTNQFIGDFDIEYLLTPRGTWRLKAYNRYNDQNYYLRQAATTQGVGIMFKRDFDSLFHRAKHDTPTDTVTEAADK